MLGCTRRTRREVAELIGSTIPTAIRVIRDWIEDGTLDMDARRIVVHDPAKLRRIAGWDVNGD